MRSFEWCRKAATNESKVPRNGRGSSEYANVEMLPVPDPIANDGIGSLRPKTGDINFEEKMFLGRIRIWYYHVITETTYERTCQNQRPRIPRLPPSIFNHCTKNPKATAVTGR